MSVAFLCHHFVNFVDLGEIFLSGFGFFENSQILSNDNFKAIVSLSIMELCCLEKNVFGPKFKFAFGRGR